MRTKSETFTVTNAQGETFRVEKWVQSIGLLSGDEEVATYSLEGSGQVLRRLRNEPLGYKNTSTGELYVRID
jgi:hypothetical protein